MRLLHEWGTQNDLWVGRPQTFLHWVADISDPIYYLFYAFIVTGDRLIGHSYRLAVRNFIAEVDNAIDRILSIIYHESFKGGPPIGVEVSQKIFQFL